MNHRAGRLLQAPLAGDVIRVIVRLEDVRDPEAVLVREREIVLDVPLGIDDRSLAAVRHEVGGAAEVLVQHLAEEHAEMIGGTVA